MRSAHGLLLAMLLASGASSERLAAQCTTYTITVGGGAWDIEIDWELVNDLGVTVASGFAPQTASVCLPNGCYTMYMYDQFGDGWNGATYVIRVQPANTIVSSGTLTNGTFGTSQVNLGGGCGGANCSNYTLTITAGAWPAEINWNLVTGTLIVATGFAPSTQVLCLDTGCFVMQLFDSFGDGWNGATWTLTSSLGATVGSGTLATGSIGQQVIDLSPTTTCASSTGAITASDCPQAVNICTNYSFQIDPNGIGSLNEIPPLGSLGNPLLTLGDAIPSAWGSDNFGCLQNNELNSTWMVVNISGSGSLEFTFGGLGSQAGFYDWIMYPYTAATCAAIMANLVPPIRCNWNNVAFGGTGLAATTPPGGDAGNYEPPLNVLAGQQYIICFSNWSSVSTLVPLEFGGTATVSCDPITLPLELIDLRATAETDGVQVEWSTGSEEETLSFGLEHGTNNSAWEVIGTLSAAGYSQSVIDYALKHSTPARGTNYYRLRMVDMDGNEVLSPMVSAQWTGSDAVIHPNPSTGSFWVPSGSASVMVLDARGLEVPFTREALRDDAQCLHIPRPGLYTVRWGTDGNSGRARVVVH
ncbi:MAG: hypothetical protein IPG10_00145 [Flavobacteriales bacterium]|nr:hypothetical protein [Flavobacteriales bacterium]MBK7754396.1 hypothetical protein [Flavobacteriales bacterium]MBK9076930.1 hypothetical protein [Flavobacteriales bacterium]MBK9538351.1 hypothetical protein [Flavobacteriales bacterium]